MTAGSLGSTSKEVTKTLSNQFNRRVGCFHVCLSDFCGQYLEEKERWGFHISVLTLADVQTYEAKHVGSAGKKLLKSCREGREEDLEEEPENSDEDMTPSLAAEGADVTGKGRGGVPPGH